MPKDRNERLLNMTGSAARALSVMLALAALSACSAGSPSSTAQPDALVGAWRSHIKVSTGALASMPDLQFMTVFNAGGTMTESSNFDGVPPVPPAYGVWRQIAERRFQAKYDFWVTKPPTAVDELTKGGGWMPNGYGTLTETITLAVDQESYVSTLTYGFFDAAGMPAPGGGTATATALRIGELR